MKAGDEVEGAGEMVECDEPDHVEQLAVGVPEPPEVLDLFGGDGGGRPVNSGGVGDERCSGRIGGRARTGECDVVVGESGSACCRCVSGEAHGAVELLLDRQ